MLYFRPYDVYPNMVSEFLTPFQLKDYPFVHLQGLARNHK